MLLKKSFVRRKIVKVSHFFKKLQNKKEQIMEEMTFPLFMQKLLAGQNMYSMTPEGIHGIGTNTNATLIQTMQKRYSQKKIKFWYHHVSRKIVIDFYAGPIADEGKSLTTTKRRIIDLDMSIKKIRKELKKWFLDNGLVFGYKIKTSFFVKETRYESVRYDRQLGNPLAYEIAKNMYDEVLAGKTTKEAKVLVKYFSSVSYKSDFVRSRVVSLASDTKDAVASEFMRIEITNQLNMLATQHKKRAWLKLKLREAVLKLRYALLFKRQIPSVANA